MVRDFPQSNPYRSSVPSETNNDPFEDEKSSINSLGFRSRNQAHDFGSSKADFFFFFFQKVKAG